MTDGSSLRSTDVSLESTRAAKDRPEEPDDIMSLGQPNQSAASSSGFTSTIMVKSVSSGRDAALRRPGTQRDAPTLSVFSTRRELPPRALARDRLSNAIVDPAVAT
jgi:hypothetical protein